MLPSGGNASIMNADVATSPNAVRREIGVVFQAQSVDIKLSAAENLRHQGHLYGLRGSPLQSRVTEMLSRVGLSTAPTTALKHSPANAAPSGTCKRPAPPSFRPVARRAHHRTRPGARRDLWNYLNILRESEGVTIVVTTHLMEEAEHCDRLAILNEGTLVALGTPQN